jgi:hypothetical protein
MEDKKAMPIPPVSKQEESKSEPVPSAIEVVALRNGFWKNSRKVEGDAFSVPSMEKVGEWMRCVDPKAEQLHQKMMRERKKSLAGK